MAIRTTKKKITFKRPFILKGIEGVNRSGTYSVETRVDHVGIFSFRKAGRTTTWIRISRTPGVRGVVQTIKIDPADLSAALLLDAEARFA